MAHELLALPLQMQVSIAAGFAAYAVAYAGLRTHHKPQELVMITGIFSGVALLAFSLVAAMPVPVQIGIAIFVPILLGAAWRAALRGCWYWLMDKLKVHGDDGHPSAWDSLIHSFDKHEVTEAMIYLIDGSELFMNGGPDKASAPLRGFVMGGTGDVIVCVDSEEKPDGSEFERFEPTNQWGSRLTFVPSDQIKRIEVRVRVRKKPTSS